MSALAVPLSVTVAAAVPLAAAFPMAFAALPAMPLHQAALDLADSLRSSFARDRAVTDPSLPLDIAGLLAVLRA